MADVKKIFENMVNRTPEHKDISKCGLCLKEKIRSEVANEFLKAGKLSSENLKEMFDEVDRRWEQTGLFLRVREMMKSGKNLEQIAEELAQEGIEI